MCRAKAALRWEGAESRFAISRTLVPTSYRAGRDTCAWRLRGQRQRCDLVGRQGNLERRIDFRLGMFGNACWSSCSTKALTTVWARSVRFGIGYVGTYRRSSQTKRWFAGRHAVHRLGVV